MGRCRAGTGGQKTANSKANRMTGFMLAMKEALDNNENFADQFLNTLLIQVKEVMYAQTLEYIPFTMKNNLFQEVLNFIVTTAA